MFYLEILQSDLPEEDGILKEPLLQTHAGRKATPEPSERPGVSLRVLREENSMNIWTFFFFFPVELKNLRKYFGENEDRDPEVH